MKKISIGQGIFNFEVYPQVLENLIKYVQRNNNPLLFLALLKIISYPLFVKSMEGREKESIITKIPENIEEESESFLTFVF